MFKNKNGSNIVYKCTVRLLEDADILECEFQPFHRGSYLVDFICDQLKIREKDYFGLRYVDISKQRQWLDLGKSVLKQCKDVDPILFSFRVKFYPADPFRLTGNGKTMLYQQLKRDLRHGRLYCSIGEAAALGAVIVQEEVGDFNEEIHVGNYVSSLNLALRQTESLEKKIMELHKKRQPYQNTAVAIEEFLAIARGLETYGLDPHAVKDHRGSQLYIGINYSGISTFISGKRSQHFRWNEVQKINFEGKMFIAHLSYTDASREPKRHTIGFKCSSNLACRYLWRCAIEQMLFFTLPSSQHGAVVSGGGFFSWGNKFKYTGRTEREIITESINSLRDQIHSNSPTSKRKASSVPATPSSPKSDLVQIRYSSLPRTTMSEPLGNCNVAGVGSLNNIVRSQNVGYDVSGGMGLQVPYLEPVSEEARMRASSNFESINISNNSINADMPNSYLKSENSIRYSTTESAVFSSHNTVSCVPPRNVENRQNPSIQPQQSKITSINERLSTVMTSKDDDYPPCNNQRNYSAKDVRRFHFIHAFIPSLVFVVIAMAASAIVVLESESDLFVQIRNLPEMINLRDQYYQPMKQYILQKVGRKT